MTLDDFKDVYEDKTPQGKLDLMLLQCDIRQTDAVDCRDARWRRNDEEEDYYRREVQHMEKRIEWLYGELSKVLADAQPRLLTLEEIPTWDGALLLERREEGCEWALYKCEQRPFFRLVSAEIFGDFGVSIANYGKRWRAWTARPTKKQMEDTLWES